MRMIRCFIAVEMAADVRQSLMTIQEQLAADVQSGAVRWVEPDNIHLTIRFLGDTEMATVKKVGDFLADVATRSEPFDLHLGRLGCFPNSRRPRVIWVGVEGNLVPLMRLQQEVEEGLGGLGWTPDQRRFHPHLTLGRVKDSRQVVEARYPWGRALASAGQQASEVCLFESDLRPTGAVYTVLRRGALASQTTPDD